MDNIYNYLYYDFSNDKLFINNIVIPKLENKIKQLESINKDKTEYSLLISPRKPFNLRKFFRLP